MTARKSDLRVPEHMPPYVSREGGAAALGVSPSTWDARVKRGRLPPPEADFSPPRWRWSRVQIWISGPDGACGPAAPQLTCAQPTATLSLMGRRRVTGIPLPPHVHHVKRGGRDYFYYQEGRGRGGDARGTRHRLPGNPLAPAGSPDNARFWAELNATVASGMVYPVGSIGALVAAYRASAEYRQLASSTRRSYEVHLARFAKPDAWGLLTVDALAPITVMTARDAMAPTPVMANQMLAVGRGLYDWAIPLRLTTTNPFDRVRPLEVLDRGHVPWPGWAVEYVCAQAPADLARMVRLAIATCQRESDLVRLGPEHRAANAGGGQGIWCRAIKTRRRRRSTFIPLATSDAIELDRWASSTMTFTNSRWKLPIERHRSDLYLFSPRGAPYTPESLRSRWGRWLETEAGAAICTRWREWLAGCVARYSWGIDPDDRRGPTIHGLRGTGILARFRSGYDVDQIANDIGAHRSTVTHYMRFRDQMEVAAAGQERLRLVRQGD